MACVELYTGRNLTILENIFEAFNSVSQVIEAYLCAPFVFGLLSSHFDLPPPAALPIFRKSAFLNLHGWLLNHTWIVWYIRDRKW
ncbi:hypothetical protein AOQ84DRAFT_408130 [Glonium stellatum]|uniref:Uncharacterized protein n=1 Tax=Glonium stellatum TaxID=574774 RepID=A0A8E2EZV4_9PEZI|nr:hypothetical protein AOQ84DRAFT_408130 [Glonium stellatum]